MTKNKFQRMTKAEQKKEMEMFYQTNRGKELKARFNRILIYSILLILFGLALLISAILKDSSIYDYIYSILILVFGIFFLIGRHLIIVKQTNEYIINKSKKKK